MRVRENFSRNLSPPHLRLTTKYDLSSLSGSDRSDDLNITDEFGRCLQNHLGSPSERSLLPLNCHGLSSSYASSSQIFRLIFFILTLRSVTRG